MKLSLSTAVAAASRLTVGAQALSAAMVDVALLWGLLFRGVALTYLISFVSLSMHEQMLALVGVRGVYPAAALLLAARRDVRSATRRFALFPTIFWACPSGLPSDVRPCAPPVPSELGAGINPISRYCVQ
eukprot:SAG11_NODE_1740_length_4338_cov_2.608634_7_plen_130_part_00